MELIINAVADRLRYFSEYLQSVGAELFREAFVTQGMKEVSILQLRYLEIIEGKPGVTPGDLALSFGVKKPTVANVIGQLERNGFIERERSRTDKRVYLLKPTDRTRRIFRMRRGMYRKLALHVSKTLTEAEMKRFLKLMEKIVIRGGNSDGQ